MHSGGVHLSLGEEGTPYYGLHVYTERFRLFFRLGVFKSEEFHEMKYRKWYGKRLRYILHFSLVAH